LYLETARRSKMKYRDEFEFRARYEIDIPFQFDPISSEYRAEFEYRASSNIEIGKMLQIMTLNFELKLNIELDMK